MRLSLTSRTVVLGVLLAVMAFSSASFAKGPEPVFLEPEGDEAVVYFVREDPARMSGKVWVYLDERSINVLPRKSYTVISTEPGLYLVWGDAWPSWFLFAGGRSYVIRHDPNRDWFRLDDSGRVRDLVRALKLTYLPPLTVGSLTSHETQRYEKAKRKAGTPPSEEGPYVFGGFVYREKLKAMGGFFGSLGKQGGGKQGGTLTLSDETLAFKSSQHDIDIPVGEILRAFITGPEGDWIAVQYGVAEAPESAFLKGPGLNAAMNAIQNRIPLRTEADAGTRIEDASKPLAERVDTGESPEAADTAPAAEPGAGAGTETDTAPAAEPAVGDPGWRLYDDLRGQFTLELPGDWYTLDQSAAIRGEKQPYGIVTFSSRPLVSGKDESEEEFEATIDKLFSGELPMFMVDRLSAKSGMDCSGFTEKGERRIRSLVERWYKDRGGRLAGQISMKQVPVGGCEGLEIDAPGRKDDGEWVLRAYAVSDGKYMYMFSLDCLRSNLENGLDIFERAMESLTLTKR